MILLCDTSTPICRLTLIDGDSRLNDEWQADRQLAKGLLGYLKEQLAKHDSSWSDITAIGVYEGPGSFTGLRIGLTVFNTIADAQNIPIVGANGDNWQTDALAKLDRGENEKVVMPLYGSTPIITKPRK